MISPKNPLQCKQSSKNQENRDKKNFFFSSLIPFIFKNKDNGKDIKYTTKTMVHTPSSEEVCTFLSECIDSYMIPRVDIVALSTASSFDHVVRQFLQTGYRWLPVFRDTLDTIVGLLPLHSVLSLQNSPHLQEKWYRHVQMPAFYPNTMTIYDALYRVHHSHKNPVIFVVDEHGGIDGMLTRNHLQKAFVHQYLNLQDHHSQDAEEKMIVSRSPVLVVDGRMDLETFSEEINKENLFSDALDVNTLGGWICSYMGRVPLTGEILHHPSGMTFEIRNATARKILQVALLNDCPSEKHHDTFQDQSTGSSGASLYFIEQEKSPPPKEHSDNLESSKVLQWDITRYRKTIPENDQNFSPDHENQHPQHTGSSLINGEKNSSLQDHGGKFSKDSLGKTSYFLPPQNDNTHQDFHSLSFQKFPLENSVASWEDISKDVLVHQDHKIQQDSHDKKNEHHDVSVSFPQDLLGASCPLLQLPEDQKNFKNK